MEPTVKVPMPVMKFALEIVLFRANLRQDARSLINGVQRRLAAAEWGSASCHQRIGGGANRKSTNANVAGYARKRLFRANLREDTRRLVDGVERRLTAAELGGFHQRIGGGANRKSADAGNAIPALEIVCSAPICVRTPVVSSMEYSVVWPVPIEVVSISA